MKINNDFSAHSAKGLGGACVRRAAMALLLCMFTTMAAWAADITQNINANGQGDITGSGTKEAPYVISSLAQWNTFASDSKYYASGTYVKLGDNISGVTTTVGTQSNPFQGTFDGGDYTLDVNISETSTQGTAPFREISGATIKDLTVTGSVTGTTHAAGLVGFARSGSNTIENCNVCASVTVNTGTNKHCGGLVGHAIHSTLNITNCIYSGTISNGSHYAGGLQGWSDGNTLNITNSLFSGSYTGSGLFHPIAVRYNNGTEMSGTISGAYYTVAPTLTDANFIAADGTLAYTSRQSFPCHSTTILGTSVYYAADLTPFGKTDIYTPDGTDAHPFIISTPASWEYFCDALLDNDTWNRFSGKTVRLDANINVTRMAGPDYHDFTGTFDGGGNTLTFTATATDNYLAPFCNVLGNSDTDHAVICNLNVVTKITATDYRHTAGLMAKAWSYVDVTNCNVTVDITTNKGTKNPTDLYPAGIASQVCNGAQLTISGCTVDGKISTDGKYAGGFIGIVQGSASIVNSVCGVTIDSSVSGDGTHGGFVGQQANIDGITLDIEGCVFNGSLLGASTTNCGGFVGWRSKTVNISNSLFDPAQVTINATDGDTPSATFARNGVSTITKSYCTQTFGTAQGTLARRVTGDQYVTTCTVSPLFPTSHTTYGVSNLTVYTYGIEREGKYYYGTGDQVLLTLAHSDRDGYTFKNYEFSAGSISNTTLTMPDADVTVSTTWEPITYTINYVLNDGTLPADAPTSYTIESETFTLPTPTREGYRFGGWYNNSGLSGNPVVATIATGSTGVMTLYAKWILLTTLYASNATTNDWMTWCSPKEWTIDYSQVAVYTIGSVADGNVILSPLSDPTVIPAYVPVLIRRKKGVSGAVEAAFSKDGDPSTPAAYSYTSVDYSASSGAVSAQVSNAGFYGNPGTTTIAVANLTGYNADTYTLFALHNGTFLRVGSTNGGVHPSRCLLAVANSALNGTASRLAISFCDMTGIEGISDPTSPAWEGRAAWYTVDGRKLDGKPSRAGVYIYNGKKQVIKK